MPIKNFSATRSSASFSKWAPATTRASSPPGRKLTSAVNSSTLFGLPPADLNSHLQFLDVGCGPGHVARSLAESGYNVTGVDRSHSLLRIARRLASKLASSHRVTFHHSPTDKLPFDDATFHLTYATGVIYWVEHLAETLREIVRVTRPNGVVAFLDPHSSMSIANARAYSLRHGLSRRDTRKMVAWATSARFNRRFEETELRRALAEAGLEQIHLERRLDGMVWFTRARIPAPALVSRVRIESLKPSSCHELRELFRCESLPFRCLISPLLDFVSASSNTGIPFLISCTATLASTRLHRTRQSCNSTHLQLQHSRSKLPRI